MHSRNFVSYNALGSRSGSSDACCLASLDAAESSGSSGSKSEAVHGAPTDERANQGSAIVDESCANPANGVSIPCAATDFVLDRLPSAPDGASIGGAFHDACICVGKPCFRNQYPAIACGECAFYASIFVRIR